MWRAERIGLGFVFVEGTFGILSITSLEYKLQHKFYMFSMDGFEPWLIHSNLKRFKNDLNHLS